MYRVIKEALVDTSPLKLEKRKRNIIEGIENTSPLLLKAVQDKAKAIILEAEKKAADLLKEAQAKSQQEFEKARERGYQEGYKAGIERANEEGELIRKKAEDILRQAEAERKEILECLKYEIISLSKEIAEKILSAQLELNPDLIIKTALEAIKLVKDRERVVFYVNPDDMGIFIAYKPQLKQILSDRAEISFIADPNVKKGGCMISTESGLVDATIEERWKEVLKVIGKKAAKGAKKLKS
ncbi:MAG: hypothetical protein LRZ91_03500 [Desulfotomaculum sp.]|nr:hypothetical protein [Desulfotomaculum sp.]